jgi:hypothetical protein
LRLLLHTCCAPCLSGSRPALEEEGFEPTAFFYNPNIHPYSEWEKRLQTLERYLYLRPMEAMIERDYPLWGFMRELSATVCPDATLALGGMMTPEERKKRCAFCYRKRMEATVMTASEKGFEAFSTTLLLSVHQDHELLRDVCRAVSEEGGIEFIYSDLRKHWNDSKRESSELRLYRQNYCGCIFSEHERLSQERPQTSA